jgi:hypothetical protein
MLAEDSDGNWCAFETALIVPRQNGKNAVLEALELAAIYIFGEQVITHSAHRYDTSLEHFMRMRMLIESSEDLLRKVARNGFVTTNGKEQIKFKSGQRILFKARSNGTGRGFTGARTVFDEAYDLPPKVLGNLVPTMSTVPNAQIVYASSSPHANSLVLHSLRNRAMNDDSGRLCLVEWGNPDDTPFNELDMDAVALANPALGIRISEQYIHDEFEALRLAPQEFARERLGVAEMPADSKADVKITLEAWAACGERPESWATAHVAEGSPVVLAVSAPADRTSASVVMAGYRADGLVHIEELGFDPQGNRLAGVTWLKDALPRMVRAWGEGLVEIAVDPKDPAASVVAEVEAELGEKVTRVTLERFAASCVDLVDRVHEGTLRHRGEFVFSESVAGLRVRQVGDAGLWVWDRLRSKSDASPLVAASLAVGALPAAVAKRSQPAVEFFAY